MKTNKQPFKKNQNQKAVANQKIAITQDLLSNRKIVSPQKLKILVLCGNELNNDELQFLHKCINLIKLDLSHNRITKIIKKVQLNALPLLKVMHLHNNRIERIQGLQGIFEANSLIYLTLHQNSVMNLPKVDHLIVNMIKTLKVFDDRVVSVQQRSPSVLKEIKGIQVDTTMLQEWKSNSISQTYFMKVLLLQIKYIENIWLWSNPIIIIQRQWKQSLKRKRENHKIYHDIIPIKHSLSQEQSTIKISILSNYFNQWKSYSKNLKCIKKILYDQDQNKNKLYLTYKLKEYKITLRNIRVRNIVRTTLEIMKKKVMLRRMAKRIYRRLYPMVISFESDVAFYYLSGISQTHRFIFNKNQKHLVENFLANIAQNFNFRQYIYSHTKFAPQKQYLSIRMMDPQTYQNKKINSVLTYLMWPSMRSVFLKRRRYQSQPKYSIIKIKPLYYIKNRFKVLTNQQIQRSIEIYKRIDKFMKVQYQESLSYFECKNEQIMKMLIRYIFYHNSKTMKFQNIISRQKKISLLQNFEQNFMLYTHKLIQRTAAAVRIQQSWRKYVNIKNQKQSLQTKLRRNRAAMKIQRFFRNILFYHRFYFQKNLQNNLKWIKDSTFMIHKTIYESILELTSYHKRIQLFPGIQLRRTLTTLQIGWQMAKYPFSPTITKSCFLKTQNFDYPNSWIADAYQLLHLASTVCQLKYCQQSFYRFTFKSIQQAKFRASTLALLTYTLYGKRYIFPINDIERYAYLITKYHEYPLLKGIKISNSHIKKFMNVKNIAIDGTFLFSPQSKDIQPNYKSIYIEFYQKKYKNFPVKYIGDLYYLLPQEQTIQEQLVNIEEKNKQIQQNKQIQKNKQLQKNKQIQKNKQLQERKPDVTQKKVNPDSKYQQIKSYAQKNYSSDINSKQDHRTELFPQKFLNVYSVDKKRLSFYDMGYTTQIKRQSVSFSEQRKNIETSFLQSKRQWIQQMQKTTFYKKQQMNQKRKNDLLAMKQKVRKQKTQIQNTKLIKELQRTEGIKKKNEMVRQFKKRAISSKKQQQADFVQQGNFVMEQQLKMIVMRNKMKQKQSKQIIKKNYISTNLQKPKMVDSLSITSKQLAMESQNKIDSIPVQIEGETGEVRNTKASFHRKSKSRNHSIGAYIRDPSFVHGVFPQQYYPIETKSKMKVIFPPL